MSDANQVRMSYVKEATFNTNPAGAFQIVRYTGSGFTPAGTATESGQINSHLMKDDPQLTDMSVTGSQDIELSMAQQFVDWIQSVVSGDVATYTLWEGGSELSETAATVDVSVEAGPAYRYTDTDVSADLFVDIKVGQWIHFDGFTNAQNNGYFEVLAVEGSGAYVEVTAASTPQVAEVGDPITVRASMIRNGTTRTSFTFEQAYLSLATPYYSEFRGCVADSMSLSFQANSLVTGSFGFVGAGFGKGTSDYATSYTSAPTTQLMNAGSCRTVIYEGTGAAQGATDTLATATKVMGIDLSIDGRARPLNVVGNPFSDNVGLNSFAPELAITQYFTDGAAYDAFYDEVTCSGGFKKYVIETWDTAGARYIFTFPHVFLDGVTLPAGALDADLELPITGRACRFVNTAGAEYAIQVDRFGALT